MGNTRRTELAQAICAANSRKVTMVTTPTHKTHLLSLCFALNLGCLLCSVPDSIASMEPYTEK